MSEETSVIQPRPGEPIPGLDCPAVPEPDPGTVAEVDARIADWVAREDTCPPQWKEGLTREGEILNVSRLRGNPLGSKSLFATGRSL